MGSPLLWGHMHLAPRKSQPSLPQAKKRLCNPFLAPNDPWRGEGRATALSTTLLSSWLAHRAWLLVGHLLSFPNKKTDNTHTTMRNSFRAWRKLEIRKPTDLRVDNAMGLGITDRNRIRNCWYGHMGRAKIPVIWSPTQQSWAHWCWKTSSKLGTSLGGKCSGWNLGKCLERIRLLFSQTKYGACHVFHRLLQQFVRYVTNQIQDLFFIKHSWLSSVNLALLSMFYLRTLFLFLKNTLFLIVFKLLY